MESQGILRLRDQQNAHCPWHDDDHQSQLAQRTHRRGGAGNQARLVDAVEVVNLLDQDAVAIDEDGGLHSPTIASSTIPQRMCPSVMWLSWMRGVFFDGTASKRSQTPAHLPPPSPVNATV